ncbi:hypothetical protein CH63R_14039 [Colletotrichum higginsianum IMI 349063]|uniref:Uncharacterized protein n=1 Tax=Colletotrichum higginsianum (strain IMI 349063) TaxID=759273 RepID=A0A1B7XSR7_COLHI|nr:hypothetical protein CH63R_14039 [Colletotrichum higginsianum IMI 349063]OBR02813.1 hypothetical protein CH63R_14039 [Colletotrichum higginsianum IMI 349063]
MKLREGEMCMAVGGSCGKTEIVGVREWRLSGASKTGLVKCASADWDMYINSDEAGRKLSASVYIFLGREV